MHVTNIAFYKMTKSYHVNKILEPMKVKGSGDSPPEIKSYRILALLSIKHWYHYYKLTFNSTQLPGQGTVRLTASIPWYCWKTFTTGKAPSDLHGRSQSWKKVLVSLVPRLSRLGGGEGQESHYVSSQYGSTPRCHQYTI